MKQTTQKTVYYHLPGLFEFYELYELFLPLFRKHREYFYDWCEIGSIYGAPADCIWGGGRIGDGEHSAQEVLHLMQEYGISTRLTFSNSLLHICMMIENNQRKWPMNLIRKYLCNIMIIARIHKMDSMYSIRLYSPANLPLCLWRLGGNGS